MSKFLFIFALSMLGFIPQSYAATFNKGLIQDTATFSHQITSEVDEDADFEDVWLFSTLDTVKSIAVSLTNLSLEFNGISFGKIDDLSAELDGEKLVFQEDEIKFGIIKILAGAQNTNSTEHELKVKGTVPKGPLTASIAGNILVTDLVVPPVFVPVPAAMWLFGSALLGLVGIRKRNFV